jgi:hypothetical protein
MSLLVHAYKRDPATGKILELEAKPTPPRNDLAGFEIWRQTVYGSPAARKLGLKVLASLGANDDVYAEGADLDQLKSETEALLANVSTIASGGRDQLGNPIVSTFALQGDVHVPREDYESAIRFRVENILEAIRLAKEVTDGSGGVYIG